MRSDIMHAAGSALELETFSWDYAPVLSQGRNEGITFSGACLLCNDNGKCLDILGNDSTRKASPLADLPGFSRSAYERDHALITPESRVWAGQVGW